MVPREPRRHLPLATRIDWLTIAPICKAGHRNEQIRPSSVTLDPVCKACCHTGAMRQSRRQR